MPKPPSVGNIKAAIGGSRLRLRYEKLTKRGIGTEKKLIQKKAPMQRSV